jgi:hypothetical protein
MSDVDHDKRTSPCDSQISPRLPWAVSGDREFGNAPARSGMRYVRISARFIDLPFRYRVPYRAAPLSKVPRTPHASFENRGGTGRFRVPHVRLPEVQSHSHDDYFERSDGLEHAWLAPGDLKARPTPATMNRSTGDAFRPPSRIRYWIKCRMRPAAVARAARQARPRTVVEHREQ